MDTRLRIQLQAENSQMNGALQASQKELQATTEALAESGKQAGISAKDYYIAKEAVEQVLDVFRVVPGELAAMGVHLAEEAAHFLEMAEAAVRSSIAIAEIPDDLRALKNEILEGTHAVEEYMEALHNDEFLRAAEEAEHYKTRMEGLTGSTEAATEAMEKLYEAAGKPGAGASNGAYQEAGLALKELKQNLEETLPLVEKLSAGSGEGLERSATVLGNAFNGLSGGLTTLQKAYHITTDEIKAQNPALDENQKIAQRTTKEMEQTKKAIIAAINVKYGDAMSRQAKTVGSAFQRVENLIHQMIETIGSYYAESVTEFVNGVGDMIEKMNEFLPVLKYATENLMNFLSPISWGMRKVVEFGNAVLETGVKIKETFESLPSNIKETFIMLGTGALVAAKVTTALTGMLAASAVFGVIFKAVGLTTTALGGVLPAAGLASKALVGVGAAANASAALCMRLIGVVMAFPVAAIAVGVLAGAFMVYKAGVRYAAEETKKYKEQLQSTIDAGQKYNDVLGKTSVEILKTGRNSGQLQLALEGIRAKAEEARVEYERLAQTVKDKQEAFAHGVGGPASEDEMLELAKKRRVMMMTKQTLKEANENLRKAIAERRAMEEKDGSSGEALLRDAQAVEDRDLQFQKDKAAGKIQTKRQEADEIKAIYERSLRDRENLEKDIEVLEARKKQGDKKDPALEERLARFTAMLGKMSELESGYRLEVLSANREAVREDLALQREAMDQSISLGKAGTQEKINMIQNFMSKNAEALKNDAELQRQLTAEIVQLVFQQRRARQQAAIETRQAERAAMDSRMDDLKYEDSIGKDRVKNLEAENKIIRQQTMAQIKDIKDKLALENEAQGDEQLRAEATKQANAQIQKLLHDEKVQLRENTQAHAEMTAQEIQDNISRINSAKELLQSKLEAAENRFGKGYDNQEEIRANKAAQLQKEIDVIRSEEKSKLATEKNVNKIRDIKIQAENQIKVLRDKYALESANFEEQLQVRLAHRKVELNEIALSEQESRRMEFEERIRTSSSRGLDVYKEEARYIKDNMDLRIAAVRLQAQEELAANQSPAEKLKIQRKAAAEEKKIRLEAAKSDREMAAKEETARAEAMSKEVDEQRDILQEKIRMGTAGLNTASQEKQIALDQLDAKKKLIQAQAKEQIAAGDIKDKARIQRDAQLQINRAVRDCATALKDVNNKYATGNTALDKLVSKYDRALADLQRMQGILDQWDEEPAPEPPTKEEMENDPLAKSKWEDAVKAQRRKVENLKKKKEEAEKKKEREDQIKAEEAIEADMVKKRREELKAEGKSSEEIRDILANESSERRKAKRAKGDSSEPVIEADGGGKNKDKNDRTRVPGTPLGENKDAKKGDGSAPAGSGGDFNSEMLSVMKAVASNTGQLVSKMGGRASDSHENGGQGKMASSKTKRGKSLTDFSLDDKMKMTPFSY